MPVLLVLLSLHDVHDDVLNLVVGFLLDYSVVEVWSINLDQMID